MFYLIFKRNDHTSGAYIEAPRRKQRVTGFTCFYLSSLIQIPQNQQPYIDYHLRSGLAAVIPFYIFYLLT